MGFISRQGISYKSLTFVILYLCLCGSNGVETGFKIYRSERDVFTNLNCNSDECTEHQCKMYDAECVRANKCEHCRCSKKRRNTFMISDKDQTKGKCKRKDILSESGCLMKYIHYSDNNNPKLRITVQTMECELKKNFTFTRDGQEWKTCTKRIFTIINGVAVKEKGSLKLKIEPTENLKHWNGSLIKLNVSCGKGNSSEEHCVLLKLESLPRYSEEDIREERSESISAPVFAVTVTFLLVALALALGCLVYYRRRKRAQVPQSNNNDLSAVNYSKEIYEEPDRIYETIQEEGNEVPPNHPGTTSDTYSYPYGNIISNPPSIEQEYTYAKETDFPKSIVGTKPGAKVQINNGVLNQTLEKPRQPSDGELEYNYAKDTDIPRATTDKTAVQEEPANNTVYLATLEQEQPPTTDLYKYPGVNIPTELEYTYAKDSDIPRVSVDKTAVPEEPGSNAVYHTLEQEQPPTTDLYKYPGTNIPTELEYTFPKDTEIPRITIDTTSAAKGDSVPATSDALYHTLEEEPAPNEQEYSHAKNTDISSIPLGTQQDNGYSSPPDSSGTYHTLEEPKPPQPAVYSTLEEPDDTDNQK